MKRTDSAPRKSGGIRPVLPFLGVLTILAVVACILPLRPTVSYSEKRKLAEFPEFSVESLISGSYFEDISTWYSDTFPGRESWLTASQMLSSLHGYGSISVQGELPMQVDAIPDIPVPTRPAEVPPATEAAPTEAAPTEETVPEETVTEETEAETGPGLLETTGEFEDENVLLESVLTNGAVFQIDDYGFYPVGFSQKESDRYAALLTRFADFIAKKNVRVVSCPPPTAVGIRVDPKYYQQLRCSHQGQMLDYMHGSMSDNVITVNTYDALIGHRDEYLFFDTDHHWTSLAAYYSYAAVCDAMGLEPAPPLEEFEVLNQGDFRGSLIGRCPQPLKLGVDQVYCYVPPADLTLNVCSASNVEREVDLFRDMTKQNLNAKYSTFLAGDSALVHLVNNDLPEDAGTCLIIKDSFGNCFVPYFGLNYRNVYAMDYRKYKEMYLSYFVDRYGIQDVIFAPNIMSTQSITGMDMLEARVGPLYG